MSASSKKKLRKEQSAAALTEKQQKELAEARNLKITTIAFVVVIALIVCTFLATQIVAGVNRSGIIEKNTIALTVGEHELSTVEMNFYFYDALEQDYNTIYETYSSSTNAYFAMIGLDLTKPLDTQVRNKETGETWADYYWQKACENARSDYALFDAAGADYKLSDEMQSNIDTQLLYTSFYASMNGAASVEEYLCVKYGNGSTEEAYEAYLTTSVIAAAYYSDHADSLEYDDPARREYETERYNNYSAYTFASYYVDYIDYLPEGVTSTNATAEQLELARQLAKEDSLILGAVTDLKSFDAAISALEVNKDAENPVVSSQNKDVKHSTLMEDYATWLGDSARKPNDVAVFPSTTTTKDADGKETEVTNGYYVFVYISRNDYLEPLANVRHLLVKFEGGTTSGSTTTYSAEEKAKAKREAAGYLMQYLTGEKTEESFIELVKAHSDDSSASTGGLFEDITPDSNYVANFLNWAIDPDREAGDAEVIESQYGYHVMYYVGDDELTYRDYLINQDMRSEAMEEWHTSLVDAVKVTEGNSDRINKDLVYAAG